MCDTATSHTCLLCMGSNLDALLHLKNAEDALQRLFPDIEWGGIVETVPEKIENPQPFLNRAARFRTSLAMTEVRSILKQIEQTNGRTPDSKKEGRIPLDIDLLSYDQAFLRPAGTQTGGLAERICAAGFSSRQFHVTQTGIAHSMRFIL